MQETLKPHAGIKIAFIDRISIQIWINIFGELIQKIQITVRNPSQCY